MFLVTVMKVILKKEVRIKERQKEKRKKERKKEKKSKEKKRKKKTISTYGLKLMILFQRKLQGKQ